MIERALVIGATGYIGRHLVGALAHSDIEVDAMRRWDSDPAAVAELGANAVVGDVLDKHGLEKIVAGHNYVFMAAAPRPAVGPRAYMRRSTLGMRNLLEVAREVDVERIVVTSCASTVGPPATGNLSTAADVYLPGSADDPVIEAQYAADQECFRQAADGMDIAMLCPGICVGDAAVLPARSLLAGRPASTRINVVDVDDVARAHLAACRRPSVDRRLVLGGENTTIGELYRRIDTAAAGPARLGRYDIRLGDDRRALRHLGLFGADRWLDSSRAEHQLGFRPRSL